MFAVAVWERMPCSRIRPLPTRTWCTALFNGFADFAVFCPLSATNVLYLTVAQDDCFQIQIQILSPWSVAQQHHRGSGLLSGSCGVLSRSGIGSPIPHALLTAPSLPPQSLGGSAPPTLVVFICRRPARQPLPVLEPAKVWRWPGKWRGSQWPEQRPAA
jgi:hypothetical protein